MVRTLATLLFCAALTAVSAQERDIQIQDTPAMEAKANERTELVSKTVGGLTAEQTAQLKDVYMQVERHLAMVDQRMQGIPQADRDPDMEHVYTNMENFEHQQMHTILTPAQMAKWEGTGTH